MKLGGNLIAPHEALEVHELVTFKNLCATKSATMAGLVKDEDLKNLLQEDYAMSQRHIKELQGLMSCADTAFTPTKISGVEPVVTGREE